MNCAQYIASAKEALGDPTMSDKALGKHLGFAQQTIAKAKSGQMSDTVALALGELLRKYQRVGHAGEVMLVALAERDCDPRVRRALAEYARGVVGEWRKRSVSTRPAPVKRAPGGVSVSRALFELPA